MRGAFFRSRVEDEELYIVFRKQRSVRAALL